MREAASSGGRRRASPRRPTRGDRHAGTPVARAEIAGLAILCLATALVFARCAFHDFVNWDDMELVTDNPLVHRLTWDSVAAMFTSFRLNTYIPLTLLTFAVEHRLFGLNPMPFHVTNIVLHVANVALAWRLARELAGGRAPVALVTAALFALHPLRVESVAWVTERKDVLYTLFYFSAALAYVRHLRTGRTAPWAASLVLFGLSILSKGVAVTLPAVLLLVHWRLGFPLDRRALLRLAPFACLSMAGAAAAFAAQRSFSPDLSAPAFLPHLRPVIGAYVLVRYLGLVAWPVGLSCVYPYHDYPHASAPGTSLPWSHYAAALAVLVAVAAVVRLGLRVRRTGERDDTAATLLFGLLFFVLTLAPLLQVIPLAGSALLADRYVYVAAFGLFFLAGHAVDRVIAMRPGRTWRATVAAGGGAVILLLAGATYARCGVWRNTETLWTDAVAKYPESSTVQINMADVLKARGDTAGAERALRDVIRLAPCAAEAHCKLGMLLALREQHDEALAAFARALECDPGHTDAWFNRGLLRARMGDPAGAGADLSRAVELDPQATDALSALGDARYKLREMGAALDSYTRAVKLAPGRGDLLAKRAAAFAALNRLDEARSDLLEARRMGVPIPSGLESLLGSE